MNKKQFIEWLSPISNDVEIRLFVEKTQSDRPLDVVDDIDFDAKRNSLIIDGQFKSIDLPYVNAFMESEISLFRQWYNSMQDTNPSYITDEDVKLYEKIVSIDEGFNT